MERFVIAAKEHESLTLHCKLFQNFVHVTLALGKTSVLSDRRDVQLKIFTSAASAALSTPETLHVVMGYTFQHLGPASTPAGAPSTVDFVHPTGEKLEFTFATGSSLGIPTPGVYKDLPERVQMVDANGWATLSDPAYYDLYPGDGSVWRFLATDLTGELGKLVSYTDPRGRVLTPEDFGVDIVRAPNGLLRQVLAPSRLADIVTRGPAGYTVTVYPLSDADAPAVVNGLYVPPAHAPTEVLTVDRGDDIDRLVVSLLPASALRNAIAALQPSLAARFSEQSLLRPALRMGCVGHRSLSVARRAKDGRGDWRSFEPYPQLIAPIVTIFDGPTPLFMDTAERLLRL